MDVMIVRPRYNLKIAIEKASQICAELEVEKVPSWRDGCHDRCNRFSYGMPAGDQKLDAPEGVKQHSPLSELLIALAEG